jgi:segregation and condensation protein A
MGKSMKYSVRIDAFEGPLDLLLHLINRYEIDIYDIPVAQITEQYMDFIHTMQELQLDVASEYLLMAATLIEIKSKMLLPKHEEELFGQQLELDMEVDPRDELVRRLIEYRKYKEAAKSLKDKESERSLIYTKEPSDLSSFEPSYEPVNPVSNITIYDMVNAFQRILNKAREKKPIKTTIERQEIPIERRMAEIEEMLIDNSGKSFFYELFPQLTRSHIVVTFLALLELMKVQKVKCIQEDNFSDFSIVLVKGDLM